MLQSSAPPSARHGEKAMSVGLRATRNYSHGIGLVLGGTILVSFETLLLRLLHVDIWTVI